MKLSIKAGSTSQSVNVFVRDSTSTTGGGLAAVAPAGGSLLSGTKLYYSFTGANASAGVAVSLAVLAAVNSAWSSAGIVTLDGTNMVGWVRIDLPDAALATSKGRVVSFLLFGGTNMAPTPFEIELTGWDNQDAVHGGMTALPNAAANANGGLPILSSSGTTLAYTISTLTTYTGNTPQTGDAFARIGLAGAGLTALGDTRIANLDALVSSRMATYTQPTGFLAATFPVTVASTTNITAGTITTVSGNVTGSVGSVSANVNAVLADAVTHGGSSAKLRLGTTTTTPALQIDGSAANGNTVQISSTGAGGSGLKCAASGTGGIACYISGFDPGAYGLYIEAQNNPAIYLFTSGATADLELGGTGILHGSLSGSVGSVATGGIVTATFAAGTTLPRVTLVDTCTTNTDMRGTNNAALAATTALEATSQSIKTKTDSLTFTVAGQVRSDVRYVNGTQVQGAGTAGNPWRPV